VIHILYVDDEPTLLETGKLFLEKDPGVCVTPVLSVKEALDRLETGIFDTVISDYEMPGTDGIAFLKIVREKYPNLPYILFTGKGREDVVIEALNNGADYYVKKGGNPRAQWIELLHKVKSAVELRQSEKKVARLNRINTVLSHINEAVVRVHDRMVLMQDACNVAVHDGGFVMAWIGFEDPETRVVGPVVAGGITGNLYQVRISTGGEPAGKGPTGTAIRERRSAIINDILADPESEAWAADAARQGYRSVASFPLSSGKTSRGAITFFSDEPGFFTDSEVRLLSELSEDISYALETIELEEAGRQVREELERSAHRLVGIINFVPEPVFAVDVNGRVIIWNRAMEKLTGAGPDEVLGIGDYQHSFRISGKRKPALLDLLSASDAVLGEMGYSRIRRDHQTITAETRVGSLNGKHAAIRVTAAPLFDEKSVQIGAIESLHEITGYRLMEEKCQLLADTVGEGILFVAPDQRIVSVNRYACTMLGYSADELKGKTAGQLFSGEDLSNHIGHMQEVARGKTEEYELGLKDNTGKNIPCRVTSASFRDDDGNFLGSIMVVAEITQQQDRPGK